MRRPARALRIAIVVIALAVLAALALTRTAGRERPPPAHPQAGTYDWGMPHRHPPVAGRLAVGVTHAQYSIDEWGDGAARASAGRVLAATATYQTQHLYGWGARNPEPRPGVYDWSSLDRRMALIRATGGAPVITLCCAPDWMKGGRPGRSDWRRLHVPPRSAHYADFAALAAAVARRYPDVRHFLVWNEMKGFWDAGRNRWDYERYTALYNAVYDALKAVDPGLAVGGPYVVLETWLNPRAGGYPSDLAGACGTVDRRGLDVLDYWLRHKRGADFVAVDAGSTSRDDRTVEPTTGAALFGALTRWLRERTALPVWWSEFHVGRAAPDGQPPLVARAVAGLLHMVDAGAAAAFVWQPQQDGDGDRRATAPALWTSTERAGGGQPLPYAEALARLQQVLADPPIGDPVSWPVPGAGVARGRDGLLLVHTGADRIEVDVQGRRLPLEPYQVRYLPLWPGAPGELAAAVAPSPPPAPCLHATAPSSASSGATR